MRPSGIEPEPIVYNFYPIEYFQVEDNNANHYTMVASYDGYPAAQSKCKI